MSVPRASSSEPRPCASLAGGILLVVLRGSTTPSISCLPSTQKLARRCSHASERHRTTSMSLDTPRAKNLALILLAMTQFVIVIDASIVNVALPSIGTALHFSRDSLSWVVNAYTLTFGGFLLLGGRLADLLGRRRMFMIGLLV